MNKKYNNNKFHLWWLDTKTNKRLHAGLAYFNESRGDYSLVINSLETSYEKRRPFEIFLRPILSNCTSIYYRVEKVIYCKSRARRHTVGEAFLNEKTDGDIHITFEPYTSSEKKLVLTLTKNQEENLCA